MQSFLEYRKNQLHDSMHKITVKEAVDRHFDILRMELLNAFKLPPILTEGNFITKSAYDIARHEDYEDNKEGIELVLSNYKSNLYKHILKETAETKAINLDDLKTQIQGEIKGLLANLRNDIETIFKTTRPLNPSTTDPDTDNNRSTTTLNANEPDPATGSSPSSSFSATTSYSPSNSFSTTTDFGNSGFHSGSGGSGGSGFHSGSGGSGGSGFHSGSGGSGFHNGSGGSDRQSFSNRNNSSNRRPEKGETRPFIRKNDGSYYQPAPYGWKKPHDGWLRGLKRSLYDPIAGWASKKWQNFRRRWHDDPMREHSMFLEDAFLDSFKRVSKVIDDFETQITDLFINRIKNIVQAVGGKIISSTESGPQNPANNAHDISNADGGIDNDNIDNDNIDNDNIDNDNIVNNNVNDKLDSSKSTVHAENRKYFRKSLDELGISLPEKIIYKNLSLESFKNKDGNSFKDLNELRNYIFNNSFNIIKNKYSDHVINVYYQNKYKTKNSTRRNTAIDNFKNGTLLDEEKINILNYFNMNLPKPNGKIKSTEGGIESIKNHLIKLGKALENIESGNFGQHSNTSAPSEAPVQEPGTGPEILDTGDSTEVPNSPNSSTAELKTRRGASVDSNQSVEQTDSDELALKIDSKIKESLELIKDGENKEFNNIKNFILNKENFIEYKEFIVKLLEDEKSKEKLLRAIEIDSEERITDESKIKRIINFIFDPNAPDPNAPDPNEPDPNEPDTKEPDTKEPDPNAATVSDEDAVKKKSKQN